MNKLNKNNNELANEIIKIVSEYYGVNIKENTNARIISESRVNAVWLIRKYTRVPLQKIGKKLNRGHSNFSVLLKRLDECLPFQKQRQRDLKELDLIIQTTAKSYIRSEKDKLILTALDRLNLMNKQQLKHFLEETENYLESIKVEFAEVN